jgi:hypothetical protein
MGFQLGSMTRVWQYQLMWIFGSLSGALVLVQCSSIAYCSRLLEFTI